MLLRERLGKEMLFFDGALGTNLQARGLAAGQTPEEWLFSNPQAFTDLYRAFLDAGCNILSAATFGVSAFQKRTGHTVEETVATALRLVRAAITESGKEAFAALDIGPTGQLPEPFGTLPFTDAYESFARTVRAGAAQGADCILIETMADTLEMKAAVLAAKENSKLPVFASFSPDANGRLLMGGDAMVCLALLEGLGVDAIGLNCSAGPSALAPALTLLSSGSATPLFIMPNAGLPTVTNAQTRYSIGPEEFTQQLHTLIQPGVCLLGGCCGTTAAHLREAVRMCKDEPPQAPQRSRKRLISSYARALDLDMQTPQIGTAIHPQGSEQARKAIEKGDLDALVSLAFDQMDEGAQLLTIHVALPGVDEKTLLQRLIPELQLNLPLPLCFECEDAGALESALRIYNGNPAVRPHKAAAVLTEQLGGTII